jgi:hypothetical protein
MRQKSKLHPGVVRNACPQHPAGNPGRTTHRAILSPMRFKSWAKWNGRFRGWGLIMLPRGNGRQRLRRMSTASRRSSAKRQYRCPALTQSRRRSPRV